MTISWPVNEGGHGTRSVPWMCRSMTAASTAATTPATVAAAGFAGRPFSPVTAARTPVYAHPASTPAEALSEPVTESPGLACASTGDAAAKAMDSATASMYKADIAATADGSFRIRVAAWPAHAVARTAAARYRAATWV
jgi:hypothetical protein